MTGDIELKRKLYYEEEIRDSLQEINDLTAVLRKSRDPVEFQKNATRLDKKMKRAKKILLRYEKLGKRISDPSVGKNTVQYQNKLKIINKVRETSIKPPSINNDTRNYEVFDENNLNMIEKSEENQSYDAVFDLKRKEKEELYSMEQFNKKKSEDQEKEKRAQAIFADLFADQKEIQNILDRLLDKARVTNEIAQQCKTILDTQNKQLKQISEELDNLDGGIKQMRKELRDFTNTAKRLKCVLLLVVIVGVIALLVVIGVVCFPIISNLLRNDLSNGGGGGGGATNSTRITVLS